MIVLSLNLIGMSKYVLLLGLIWCCATVAAQKDVVQELEVKLPLWMEEAGIPGMSLAVIQEGQIQYQKALGIKDANTKAKVDDETIFEAASLTKPVFAYALCQLVSQGKFDLDRPLENYWSYPDPEPLQLRKEITARMVLTHSTGLPNWRRPRQSEQVKINFTPGNRFSYSGEGFVYLAKVVAKLTGQPTHEWIQQMVFEPLGMTHSTMVWNAKLGTNSALPHDKEGAVKGKYKPQQANAAASLHTTAGDYARFLLALIKGERLSPAVHKMMLSTQRNVDPKCSQCRTENSDPDFKKVSWGLGIGLEHTEQDYIWHWGDNGNFKSYVCASLTTGTGLVYFANSNAGLSLRDQLVTTVLPGDHPAHQWVKYKQLKKPDSKTSTSLAQLKAAGISDELEIYKAGSSLLKAKQTEEALKIFHYNAELHPKSWRTWDTLGYTYSTTPDKEKAIKYLEKALELHPENKRGRALLEKLKRK